MRKPSLPTAAFLVSPELAKDEPVVNGLVEDIDGVAPEHTFQSCLETNMKGRGRKKVAVGRDDRGEMLPALAKQVAC